MAGEKPHGNKTHEHQVRQFEQGETSQDWRPGGHSGGPDKGSAGHRAMHPEARDTDAPTGISRQGMNQESRHNKDGVSASRKNQ